MRPSRSALLIAALAGLSLAPLHAAAAQRAAYRPGIDITDYQFSIDIPDGSGTISARAVLGVRRTAPVSMLRLDLLDLRVDSVLVGDRPVSFSQDSAGVSIPLPAGRDSLLTVAVRYGGRVRDGLVFSTDSTGRWTAFGDNWPNRARHWLASVDHPSDKATVSWTVTAPSDHRVVANGELEEETPLPATAGQPPRTLTRWREARPIPVYTMVIAVAPLVFLDLNDSSCALAAGGACVRQSVYVAPEVRGFLPGPFANAPDIVRVFTSLVGPFPYEKLAHLESATRFGGMENASAIFYADRPFRRGTMGPGVIAHETAHQWFGDAVTEARWGDLWLSEGFASYFEQLWWRHARGDSALQRGMSELREQIIRSPVTAARPVLDTAETDYMKLLNTNSYQKGAWTLHMLRSLVGDSAFFRGLRTYYARYRGGNALTDDLQREMERSSGKSLGWFFDEWLRRPGFAELSTSWRYDAARHRVVLQIEQGARFAPYRFPLVVELRGASGAPQRAVVNVTATRSQRITLPIVLTGAPHRVILDPDVQLLASFTEH